MSDKVKTNRLSIYLVKEEFDSPDKIFKDLDSLNIFEIDITSSGLLYTKDSVIYPPKWISNFFLRSAQEFNLKNSSSQAVFLKKLQIGSCHRYFAIPFGMGYHMLKAGIIEERFGLKIVLNAVDENQLRSIDKKNMSNVPKQSREQVAINSIVADFGIDIEQDLILGVTGKSKIDDFGKTITGKDALNASVKIDVNSINNFLLKCFEYYQKDDYKTSFGWIDQIAEIKSAILIKSLNSNLIDKIKSNSFDKIWMAIPEIIEWDDVEGFNYSFNKNNDEKTDDIFLPSFLEGLYPDGNYTELTMDSFKKNKVLCHSTSNNNIKYQWSAYNCLYCEIEDNDKTFLLTNGKWYQIENDFVSQINNDYQELLNKTSPIQLPDYSHENEGAYNTSTASSSNKLFLMDKKNIPYGGGYSKIEFCDLYSSNKELIHVKYYGGSSVLSHLFNQGLVSGELFKAEKHFRDKVNTELDGNFKLENTASINASDYKIIFAIISHVKKQLDIPFFSKVSLKNAKKRLETIGYQVYLVKIPVTNDLE